MPNPSKYNVKVSAELTFNNEPLLLTYSNTDKSFSVYLGDRSLGEMIEGVVRIFRPSFSMVLPFPWDKLFGIELKDLTLYYWPKTKMFGFEISGIDADLGIIRIDYVRVEGKSKKDVNVIFKGNFFGQDTVAFNATGAEGPPMPPKKLPAFDLKFLGLGQHVALRNAASFNHVRDAIGALKSGFCEPAEGTVVPVLDTLKFDENSNWLFGIDAEILPPTVLLQIIFNDPNLYGLYIKLGGEKAKSLAGLEFEIIYKKITEDIGVYQSEIKLPFYLRNMEFGALSITLPKIGVEIYTNGNFRIDFGFPHNMNFADSFIIQYFPFLGSGGFYFASLNGATSKKVPKTSNGTFDTVIEFGIGLRLGWGKRIDKGIMSAEVSLTYFGIIEGVFADFKPLPINGTEVVTGEEALYYRLQGTFGIIGRIWGSIDFAIISASFDIVIYAAAVIDLIAAEPLLLKFVAGIRVTVRVRIGAGPFSFTIRLSFRTTVRASFKLGASEPAPWKPLLPQSDFNPGAIPLLGQETQRNPIDFNWNSLVTAEEKQTLEMYFLPQISARRKNGIQEAMGVAMLFLQNQIGSQQSDDLNQHRDLSSTMPFEQLCIKFLTWVLNAAKPVSGQNSNFNDLQNKQVTLSNLFDIYYSLNLDDRLFELDDIEAFLSENFVFDIYDSEALDQKRQQAGLEPEEKSITVFPMISGLNLTTRHGEDIHHQVDFSHHNMVNDNYLEKVTDGRKKYAQGERRAAKKLSASHSLCSLLFTDYFQTLAKDLVQGAIDALELYRFQIPFGIVKDDTVENVTISKLAELLQIASYELIKPNKSNAAILKENAQITVEGVVYQIVAGDSLQTIRNKEHFKLNDSQFESLLSLNKDKKLFNPGVLLSHNDTEYVTRQGDSLASVSTALSISLVQLSQHILENPSCLKAFETLRLPELSHLVQVEDSFLSIATKYQVSLLELIESNKEKEEILQQDAILVIENLPTISIKSLLNYLLINGDFEQSAGLVSRVFLNGLRLPTDGLADAQSPDPKDDALYSLTGQAFAIAQPEEAAGFDYTIELAKPTALSWVKFAGNDSQSLVHHLDRAETDKVRAFAGVSFLPDFSHSRTEIFKYQPRRFALTNNIIVRFEGEENPANFLQFSQPLQGYTAADSPLPGKLSLFKAESDRPSSLNIDDPIAESKYEFGLLLNIYIRKLPPGATGVISDHTYEIFGADSGGMQSLTHLIKDLGNQPIEAITLFFRPQESKEKGFQSHRNESVLNILINTNLSTESNPEEFLFQAEGDNPLADTDPNDFVKRLWKASVVRTGGYYLYYTKKDGDEGLPDEVFDDNGAAEIGVLITFKAKDELKSYANGVLLNDAINSNEEVINAVPYVKRDGSWQPVQEKSLTVAQGQEGFDLVRDTPEAHFGIDESGPDGLVAGFEIEQQYNLLSFEVVNAEGIIGLGKSESISPSKDDVEENEHKSSNRITDSTDDWEYRKVIQLKDVVDLQSADNNLLPTKDSPYIALGKQVTFQFEWRDNHGFELDPVTEGEGISQVSIDVRYRDSIIGITQWPGLEAYYDFRNKADNLLLKIAFDAKTRYKIDQSLPADKREEEANKVKEMAYNDLKTYRKAAYQLLETSMNMSLEVSMMPDKTFDLTSTLKPDLIGFLKVVVEDVQAAFDDPLAFQSSGTSVKVVDFSEKIEDKHPDNIYSLDVNLVLSRDTGLIDPEMADEAGVQEVSCSIKPKNEIVDPEDLAHENLEQLYALRRFAKNFETSFDAKGLKIALSYKQGLLSEKGDLKRESEIWIVRLANEGEQGIDYNIEYNKPRFYAPQPLSNQLLLLENVVLKKYITSTGLSTETAIKTFTDVDPEQWARVFLEDFEDLLKPEYTVPLAMLDQVVSKRYLQQLLEAKRTLATGISFQTIPVLKQEVQNKDLAVAREKIKQQLLINLLDGYSIDTVVQYPVKVDISSSAGTNASNAGQLPPNLYGKTISEKDKGENTKDYSLSTGKIPLADGSSNLTFTFSSIHDTRHSNVPLDLEYKVSHLEYDITDVEQISPGDDALKDFTLSKWLSFVIPFVQQETVPTTYIPIPIRSYPSLPNLAEQKLATKRLDIKKAAEIASLKKYDYAFEYKAEFVAQDLLSFEVVFNARKDEHDAITSFRHHDSLDTSLAQYMEIRSHMRDDLAALLQNKNSAEDIKQAEHVAESWVNLYAEIAQAWYDRYNPDNLSVASQEDIKSIIAKFNIDEESENPELSDDDPANHYLLHIERWEVDGPGVDIPDVIIPGYQTALIETFDQPLNTPEGEKNFKKRTLKFFKTEGSKKVFLSFSDGIKLEKRKIAFKDLDVLGIQNAWAGTRVIRNTELMEGTPYEALETNSQFIYRTPLARYNSAVTPHIVNSSFIDYLDQYKGDLLAPMDKQLHRLVEYLFTNTPEGIVGSILAKIKVSYAYLPAGQPSTFPKEIMLPIYLTTPIQLDREQDDASPSEALSQLASAITGWLKKNEPILVFNRAKIYFDVTCFSLLADGDLPIFQMKNLFIQEKYIDWRNEPEL